MSDVRLAFMAAALTAVSSIAMAQGGPSASTVGAHAKSGGSATVGTVGSASAGGTSASTLGLGGNVDRSSGHLFEHRRCCKRIGHRGQDLDAATR